MANRRAAPAKPSAAPDAAEAESRLATFFDRYDPAMAAAGRACRQRLHARFPRSHELVYDNYNALAIGYAPTERASDVVVSFALYPRWVTLFFMKGAALPDPERLLGGSGRTVRSIRLRGAEDLDRPAILALIAAAREAARLPFDAAPPVAPVIKSVSAVQRPRRPER